MTKTYTITLSDAEDKALSTIAFSQQGWINNAIHERCRIAMEDIVTKEVDRITSEGGVLSGTKEDIVLAAPIEALTARLTALEAK